VASGLHGVPAQGQHLATLLGQDGGPGLLRAISAGAVAMGALTYVGNGPNFLVKAVAEREGVAVPGFLGYLGYSLPVLLPLFAVATLLFFRA
jgi:Na+/H+ antiporter NhaD/arsenite permease-like protein